jgi:acyl carrier protein
MQGMGLKNEVIGTLKSEKILRELSRLARQKLSYEDRLYDLYMDSAAMMDFILGVEDEFDITLNMRETSELKTVSDLVELVESKLK